MKSHSQRFNQVLFLWREVCGYNFSRSIAMNSVSAPCRCTPSVWLNWQAFGRPRRQDAQAPQLVYGETATSVPAASPLSRPTCTIVAQTSCPRIRGKETSGLSPQKEFKSLPQNPTIRTFNSICSTLTPGSGMVSIAARPGF
jgi:hypothetical protein